VAELADRLADEVAELLTAAAGKLRRLGVDRIEPALVAALQSRGVTLGYAQEPMEHARAIKSEDEIWCTLGSIAIAETGIGRMRAALAPGMTENELFAILHHTNIAMGGEWCEYRLLASGGRTNPWGQECSDKMIRAGERRLFRNTPTASSLKGFEGSLILGVHFVDGGYHPSSISSQHTMCRELRAYDAKAPGFCRQRSPGAVRAIGMVGDPLRHGSDQACRSLP
jgi:hypothetical protein